MTVEGELDDISGIGQTKAAHALTPNIPGARHVHWEQPRVGHYGIFNGRKWREQIMPRVRDFIRDNDAVERVEEDAARRDRESSRQSPCEALRAICGKIERAIAGLPKACSGR